MELKKRHDEVLEELRNCVIKLKADKLEPHQLYDIIFNVTANFCAMMIEALAAIDSIEVIFPMFVQSLTTKLGIEMNIYRFDSGTH